MPKKNVASPENEELPRRAMLPAKGPEADPATCVLRIRRTLKAWISRSTPTTKAARASKARSQIGLRRALRSSEVVQTAFKTRARNQSTNTKTKTPRPSFPPAFRLLTPDRPCKNQMG